MTIGIVVALSEELSTLTPVKLVRGESLALNSSVIVCLSGAGHENAADASEKLIAEGARKLISWGCAAGLSPQLHPGDLMVASEIIVNGQIISDPSGWAATLAEQLRQPLTICQSSLASRYGLITQHEQKQSIHQQTAAAALDMESAAVAVTALRHQLPFATIRAIADPASMTLPSAVAKALNDAGEVATGVLLIHLLSHFWEIPALIKLGLHFNAAKRTLKTAASQLDRISQCE